MNYDTSATPNRVIEPLQTVHDTASRALELARDVRTLTGSIKDKMFRSDLQASTPGTVAQAPCCVVDFLEVIIGELAGTAKQLTEIDNRL